MKDEIRKNDGIIRSGEYAMNQEGDIYTCDDNLTRAEVMKMDIYARELKVSTDIYPSNIDVSIEVVPANENAVVEMDGFEYAPTISLEDARYWLAEDGDEFDVDEYAHDVIWEYYGNATDRLSEEEIEQVIHEVSVALRIALM